MDEYSLLTLAKLKADRRKLEREQRERERRNSSHDRRAPADEVGRPPTAFPLLTWR
jgi:hypothetical protein